MRKIFKYELRTTDSQLVHMPEGAEVLSLQVQHGAVCLWAMVDDTKQTGTRLYETFGTGHTIYEDMGVERRYIGTYQLDGGTLVFHVFERLS